MGAAVDISGQKRGAWTVLRKAPGKSGWGKSLWLCRCECGLEQIRPVDVLKKVIGSCRHQPKAKSAEPLPPPKKITKPTYTLRSVDGDPVEFSGLWRLTELLQRECGLSWNEARVVSTNASRELQTGAQAYWWKDLCIRRAA